MDNNKLQKHIARLQEYFDGKRNLDFIDVKIPSRKELMAFWEKGDGKPKLKKSGGPLEFTVDIREVESYIGKNRIKQSFFDLVEMHMQRNGMSPSDVYRNAQISKQDFSRYVRPEVQSVNRAIVYSLAVGLALNCNETKALLRSAGLGFNKRSKFDLIIMYCIENELYNIQTINMLLEEFGQKMLKSHYYKEGKTIK